MAFYTFPQFDERKISVTNVWKRLNQKIRCHIGLVAIFPDAGAYTRWITTWLLEYAKDWSASKSGFQ